MIILTKENVTDYVKSRLDFFNTDGGPVTVSAIGEGSVEEDGDGFINMVFRVSDGKYHLIVKQSTAEPRCKGDFVLDVNRFKLEYESMQIRKAIVPDLIPIYMIVTMRTGFLSQNMYPGCGFPVFNY